MVRYMADSVDCTQIPGTVAVPGRGDQPVALRAGYASSSRYHGSSFACGQPDVVIDVAATVPSADVLDIETGDATPDSAPNWVRAHNALNTGFPAVLYCNRSTITAVANALVAAGLQVVRDYRWWIARLDGIDHVADMTGVVAVQTWGAGSFSTNIDLSVVYDDTFKASPAPPAPEIHGLIAVKYNQTPGLSALFGAPITPESGCPDGVGRFNHFALNNGSIYWTPALGAHEVHGGIAALWAAMNWEKGPLGYPISDEFGVSSFDSAGAAATWRQSNFEHGCITWTPDGGPVAHVR